MANGLLTPHRKNGRQHRYLQWTRWAAPHFPLASKFLEDTWDRLGQACFFEHAQISHQQLVGMGIPRQIAHDQVPHRMIRSQA